MIQPHVGQRVTVIDVSGPESGISGVVVSRDLFTYPPTMAIQDDYGRVFNIFSYRLRLSEKST